MALAGAPRLILFDEPAAGLSPAERRELVALLASLPPHMSYLLIEHDLEIAMRAATKVTVMHNGRVLKSGTPDEIENDAEVQAIYMGGKTLMAGPGARDKAAAPRGPVLAVEGLDVYYGHAHVLQGVSFELERGVLGIVGRNGMGKTTLCNAITGLVPASGSIRLFGEQIRGMTPNRITRRGIAYVPQGRRVWPSLSVDETLRLVARQRREVDRIYAMFPRLAERKDHGGAQLSGGEQQMLAIGRALLLEPRLLVMDEPTEGLAPMVVEQVVEALRGLAAESEIAVLLIEQNLGVAIDVADRVGVMVNGRIAHEMAAAELGADRELQERLLGLRSGGGDDDEPEAPAPADAEPAPTQVFTVRRAHGDGTPTLADMAPRTVRGFNRWNAGGTAAPVADIARVSPPPRSAASEAAAAPQSKRSRRRARPGAKGQARAARCSTSPSPPAAAAPPTSPAPSTPRAASSTSCASAWKSSACGSSPSTSRPRASRRPRRCIRARSRAIIPTASPRSSAATAAARSRRWRSPSPASCRRVPISAACSRPAAPAARRSPPPACGRCRSACPR